MRKTRILRGVRAMCFVTLAIVVGCGGGDDAGSGGDDDSGNAGAGDEGGTSGSGGSETGGTESGGRSGSSGSATGGRSGSGNGGSAGTATGATGPVLDRIEEACEVDCAGQFELECAPANQNTLTCKSACAAQTGQLGDFCLVEYAELVECRGAGGYECVTTYPYPNATCASEQLAFQTCMMDIGCKRSCDKSVDEGCTSMSLDECIEECIAEGDALPMDCSYYTDSIAFCKVSGDAACVDGELKTPMTCASSVMNVADCVAEEAMDMCGGWCWAANELGCGGEDCATECANRVADPTCGMAWNEVLDCGLFFGDAGCAGDFLAANSICDSEMTAYTMCTAGGGI